VFEYRMFCHVLATARSRLTALSARAETVVRYGISMADIPLTRHRTRAGAINSRLHPYYPLVSWEMNVSERPGKLCRLERPNGRSMTRTRPSGASLAKA